MSLNLHKYIKIYSQLHEILNLSIKEALNDEINIYIILFSRLINAIYNKNYMNIIPI